MLVPTCWTCFTDVWVGPFLVFWRCFCLQEGVFVCTTLLSLSLVAFALAVAVAVAVAVTVAVAVVAAAAVVLLSACTIVVTCCERHFVGELLVLACKVPALRNQVLPSLQRQR